MIQVDGGLRCRLVGHRALWGEHIKILRTGCWLSTGISGWLKQVLTRLIWSGKKILTKLLNNGRGARCPPRPVSAIDWVPWVQPGAGLPLGGRIPPLRSLALKPFITGREIRVSASTRAS